MKPLIEFQGRGPQPIYCERQKWPEHWFRYGERSWSEIRAQVPSSEIPIGVHCFTDDARFESLWTTERARVLLAENASVFCAPDFSFSSFAHFVPAAFQIWRSNVIAAELQRLGLVVVPVLSWGPRHEVLFQYAASCVAPGSVVALRAPKLAERVQDHLFWEPLAWFVDQVKPSEILWFGEFGGPHREELTRRVGTVTPISNRLQFPAVE